MDCSCINLTFSFSFQLLGRIFTTKNEHLLAKIDYKTSKNFNVREAPRDMHAFSPVN
jgi:hypothetical protein